jgi:hypothetical protein
MDRQDYYRRKAQELLSPKRLVTRPLQVGFGGPQSATNVLPGTPPRFPKNSDPGPRRATPNQHGFEGIVAVMRKMVVTLNAMLRDNTEWRPSSV